MDLSFLPNKILSAIKSINQELLYEIRVRTGFPIKVNYNNDVLYLTYNGVSINELNSIICNDDDISTIINNITERSLYAFNDRIKDGYLTTKNGVRIGIAGECVFCDNKIHTIKNFTSLNIRIPHQIKDCSISFIDKIIDKYNNVNNTLLVSPPFLGKTTLLKDIATKINQINNLSILIIDERGEFAEINGVNIDKISFSNKIYAFNNGIRSLSPSVVITDELSNERDWLCVKNAINSGVKIIASCHSDNVEQLCSKDYFIKNLFDRYIFLSKCKKFGQVEMVLNKEFNII